MLSGNYRGPELLYRPHGPKRFRPPAPCRGRPHVRHFCQKTFRPFLDYAAAAGRLSLPGYFQNPARYLHASGSRRHGVHRPAARGQGAHRRDQGRPALAPGIRPGARPRPGGHPLELAQAKELAEEKGLELDLFQLSTAVANNPAAVTDDQGKALSSLLSSPPNGGRAMNMKFQISNLQSSMAARSSGDKQLAYRASCPGRRPGQPGHGNPVGLKWSAPPRSRSRSSTRALGSGQGGSAHGRLRDPPQPPGHPPGYPPARTTASVLGSYRDMKVVRDQASGAGALFNGRGGRVSLDQGARGPHHRFFHRLPAD